MSARLSDILPPLLSLLAAAAAPAQEGFHPKVKWLYASAGLSWDYWRGSDSLGWEKKDRNYNPPQTLSSVTLGGSAALTSKVGLYLALPFFYNRIERYTDHAGLEQPALSASGVGDLEIGLPVKVGKAVLQPQAALPGFYAPDYHPFYHPRFQQAWSGLGVYRAGLGLSLPWKAHYYWASAEMVLLKPGETDGYTGPLVEEGDYILKGGYAYKRHPLPWLQWKAGADASYNSLSWAGADPQHNFSVEPKVSASYLKGRQELSLAAGATLYSWQGGDRTFHSYGSRRVYLGFYYGYYL
jgi:hypothetical protein